MVDFLYLYVVVKAGQVEGSVAIILLLVNNPWPEYQGGLFSKIPPPPNQITAMHIRFVKSTSTSLKGTKYYKVLRYLTSLKTDRKKLPHYALFNSYLGSLEKRTRMALGLPRRAAWWSALKPLLLVNIMSALWSNNSANMSSLNEFYM